MDEEDLQFVCKIFLLCFGLFFVSKKGGDQDHFTVNWFLLNLRLCFILHFKYMEVEVQIVRC